jgi:hypothetical protein
VVNKIEAVISGLPERPIVDSNADASIGIQTVSVWMIGIQTVSVWTNGHPG